MVVERRGGVDVDGFSTGTGLRRDFDSIEREDVNAEGDC